MNEVKIAGLVGSLRRGSFSKAVMDTLPGLLPEGAVLEDVPIGALPLYNEDLKGADGAPAEVRDFARRLREAQALVIVTPEYNRSFSGVLKNAIDWASKEPEQPFRDKPVAVISQSPGALGGILANHHLRQVLAVLGAVPLAGGEIAIRAAKDKVDGGVVTDAETVKMLGRDMERLVRDVRMRAALAA